MKSDTVTRALVAVAWLIASTPGCGDDGGTSGFVAPDVFADGAAETFVPPDVTTLDSAADPGPGTDADTIPDAADPIDADPIDTATAPPDTGPETTPADTTTSGDSAAETTDSGGDTVDPGECQSAGDCAALHPGVALGECEAWLCDAGAACVTVARDDCFAEEPIGAGWSGGQCDSDAACGPLGSICIPEVGGGSCSIPCTQFCDDEPGAPVTFCIDADAYQSRMQTALPADLSPALCVAKCDFSLFPRTGCRDGLHCELHSRYQSLVEDEVCVPGPWSIGLQLSADGRDVLGLDGGAPAPAAPFSRILEASCDGFYRPIPARLFRGLADTLSAMDADGRDRNWERLCAPPAGLPALYGLAAEASAGRAFRLSGARLDVVDWTAAALYGSKSARGWLVGGPLFTSRAMVYRSGTTTWLYTDAADDFPYPDPERGRHFGVIDGDEWVPIDGALEAGIEYTTFKASGGQRFHRQWGRRETVDYITDMALDYLVRTGLPLGIGDMSLVTGGDIDDHASHEVGLDVDIYLLTYPPDRDGQPDLGAPFLWVSDCSESGGWDCWYYDGVSGDLEDPSAPLHVAAAELLRTLAQFALDYEGASHFVQHDVVVLAPFRALSPSAPRYVDATNDEALGWPPHLNHVHVRFFDW